MSSSASRMSAQGPTLPPIRSLQQPAGATDAHRLPTTNRLPPLRRPVQPNHRSTNSLGASIPTSGLAHTPEFFNPIHRDIASSMAAQEGLSRSLEKAFNVYNDRVRSDLRDFRGLCTSLVAQEQQEAMKWYSLCLKVMKERDIARQQLHLLSLERNSGSLTSPPISPSSTDQEAELNKALKRGREDYMMSNTVETASASSRSSSVETRPTRPLRLSPVHSPSGSPTRMSTSPLPVNDPSPSTLSASPTSMALPPSPQTNSHGRVDHRPGKRRKSCEAIGPTEVSSPRVKQQSRTPSPLSFPGHLRSLPPQQSADFPHIDLMYVPTNGLLVCRACILHKSKAPTVEPKSFPTTASWDDLRQHCLRAHPEACADVARLCPAEIFELRRRLSV
ncbi:hypothetical protein CPB83DRAFT_144149 [Crepidotus variabilis]|uniref:Uncharacterized protein n=1 Tax=Crepidotus variabilis TaxID=179855 RepID=A0A9P6JSU9_9AGAR|nr:hypothetical protein CPB83DRAFT_144149 [Crepidotus variabilis]